MRHATIADLPAIMKIFQKHRRIFPHIRSDAVKHEIEAGQVIFEDGVVITYGIYKRRQALGTSVAWFGDGHLGQIVNGEEGNGRATAALKRFFGFIRDRTNTVWLTVRRDNLRARDFYVRNGMTEVGEITWSGGTIEGCVYNIHLKG